MVMAGPGRWAPALLSLAAVVVMMMAAMGEAIAAVGELAVVCASGSRSCVNRQCAGTTTAESLNPGAIGAALLIPPVWLRWTFQFRRPCSRMLRG